MAPLNLLYIEDSRRDADLVLLALKKEDLEVNAKVVDSLSDIHEALKSTVWDLVLSDCHLPMLKVEDALEHVREFDVDLPFIAVSGAIGEEEAVNLLKRGAQDFVSKQNLSRLAPAIRRELSEAEVRRARACAERSLRASEERFKLAMQGANDGLWDWITATEEVYFSPRWKQMLGYDEVELEGSALTFLDLLHSEDRERVARLVQSLVEGKSKRFETEYRMRHHNGGYVDVLSRAFAVSLDSRVQRLVGTHVDISASKQTERVLRHSKEQLRALSSHIQKVREEEKAHVAQEVHDELGATFTALNMDIHWMRERLTPEMSELHDKVGDMAQLVQDAAEACSRIVTELRPSILDDLGLLATIEWQAKEFAKRYDIVCNVSTTLKELALSSEQTIAVFRIFQESLTNVARHARAERVDVFLLCRNNRLVLQVADNGVGLPFVTAEQSSELTEGDRRSDLRRSSAFRSGSHGIRGMGERAKSLGGTLNLESEPGDGTRVVLSLPLDSTKENP